MSKEAKKDKKVLFWKQSTDFEHPKLNFTKIR